jgi:hypothetical protein
MKSLRTALGAALFAALLPCVGMAQRKPSTPAAKLPSIEVMGFQLGISRAQADSVTAAHGWKYSNTTDEIAEIEADEWEGGDAPIPSLGPVFCDQLGADCALARDITLTFKNGKLSEVELSGIFLPVEQCPSSWDWVKTVEGGIIAKYGKPAETPNANLRPEALATLDEAKTVASWLFSKGKYASNQTLNISVLHTDTYCWGAIVIWDMSELDD